MILFLELANNKRQSVLFSNQKQRGNIVSKQITVVAGGLHWLVSAYWLTITAMLRSEFIHTQYLCQENYQTSWLGNYFMIMKVIPAHG